MAALRDASITIGIPTLNGPERLDRCLTSIRRSTVWARFGDVKILVHDDASSEEALKLNKDAIHRQEDLRARAGLELLMSTERRGIAAGWNFLARHRPSDVTILLNDDIEVEHDWLDVLAWSLINNPHAGMIGLSAYTGVTRRQVRDLRAAGYRYANGCTEEAIDALDHVVFPQNDYREAHLRDGGGSLLASCGYAFGFRRDAFETVGGFDERYFTYYEEVDFGISLRRQGFVHYMADYPTIWHMGGATMSLPEMNASDKLAASRALFEDKWGKKLAELHDEGGAQRRPVKEWNSQKANWT